LQVATHDFSNFLAPIMYWGFVINRNCTGTVHSASRKEEFLVLLTKKTYFFAQLFSSAYFFLFIYLFAGCSDSVLKWYAGLDLGIATLFFTSRVP
jgi:hypothetical protein